ncbi:Peptidoglycan/LPS O-acetylase OafA/YrhL, contains acyltransferase and SGNH-hydrolase domains [Chitinophaga jiangningensis]|uniref:Peptidoglycan/LPS O-acetylase OafA/YrhL, contains acyltransferase and SGNH-hydrolase domains n=1 Tax=Chitinophaga jiangningensis TaxID=1419482 RepID=A0A1M7BSS6_9BACT|nr:acyltransferase [Chitinophaga jiangningensis]SHL58030.1 Peptidoglycan/LPS O-acetylase OafA/YrhL, contains acyltransferase and SGNH-hydrolase domains [Chitinophaga jiangningensis]
MSPVSLLPVVPILLLVLVVITLVSKLLHITPQEGRYKSIDGLRGYLAFFVFLHHAVIWYFFLQGRGWTAPPSQVYSHFGPTSVSLFFMITAFLFFSKLMAAKQKGLDWLKLYVSRLTRILPLYGFMLLLLLLMVGILSKWMLKEPLPDLLLHIGGWLLFMEPAINRMGGTRFIVAGVVWSLAFEWLFYFSLPFWGWLLFRLKATAVTYLFAGLMLLIFIWVIQYFYPYNALARMSVFAGGMVPAFIAGKPQVQRIAAHWLTSVAILLLLCFTVLFFPHVFAPVPYVCLTLCFIAIACGNTLFGILTHQASCLLGQISYSIYLIHGVLLFVVFYLCIGKALTPQIHWLMVTLCSVVLMVVCSLTYRFIERPGIDATDTVKRTVMHYLEDE